MNDRDVMLEQIMGVEKTYIERYDSILSTISEYIIALEMVGNENMVDNMNYLYLKISKLNGMHLDIFLGLTTIIAQMKEENKNGIR